MTCRSCQKKISLLLDDALNPRQRQQVMEHMDTCPTCRSLYDAMKQATDHLDTLREEPLPIGFENRLHFKLEEASKEQHKPYHLVLRYAAAATAALVIIVSAVSILPKLGGMDKMMSMEPKAVLEDAAEEPAEMIANSLPENETAEAAPMADDQSRALSTMKSAADSRQVFITIRCNEDQKKTFLGNLDGLATSNSGFKSVYPAQLYTGIKAVESGVTSGSEEGTHKLNPYQASGANDRGDVHVYYVPPQETDQFLESLQTAYDVVQNEENIVSNMQQYQDLHIMIEEKQREITTLQSENSSKSRESLNAAESELALMELEMERLVTESQYTVINVAFEGP